MGWVGFVYMLYFAILIGICIMFGKFTQKVIYDKGYNENWFWWGFFFGWIALLVAALKQPVPQPDEAARRNEQIRNGYWLCSCGRTNAPYITTCVCGKTPKQVKDNEKKADELSDLKMLKEYKELLDKIAPDKFDV